uniref:Uncharacterized protein n=1 Tax=Meloidogyne floridensis TaxID=298350 RepID=A0A915NPM8_9BILA
MGGNSSSCRTSQYRAQIRNNEDVHERIKKTYDSIEKLKQMTQNGMVTQEELENKVESIEEENRQLREAAEKCPDDSALKRALEAINELVCEIGRAVGRGIRAVFDVIGRAIKGIGNVIARALTAIGNVISSCLKAIERRDLLKFLDVLSNRLIAMENMLQEMAESNARLHQRIDQLEEENRKLRKIIDDSGSSFWKDLWHGLKSLGASLVTGIDILIKMDNEEDKNALKKIDEIEHRANILEKALQEQEEIRTKSEERIEAISITQEHNKKQLKNKIKKEESFWKYLTNFFSSA